MPNEGNKICSLEAMTYRALNEKQLLGGNSRQSRVKEQLVCVGHGQGQPKSNATNREKFGQGTEGARSHSTTEQVTD
jgi:hypothetical protein